MKTIGVLCSITLNRGFLFFEYLPLSPKRGRAVPVRSGKRSQVSPLTYFVSLSRVEFPPPRIQDSKLISSGRYTQRCVSTLQLLWPHDWRHMHNTMALCETKAYSGSPKTNGRDKEYQQSHCRRQRPRKNPYVEYRPSPGG